MAVARTTSRRASAWTGLAVVVAVSTAFATPARAQGPGDDAQRTELYREAVRAATAGRWAEAKEKLRAVLAIRPSPKVYFSLAQSEEQLGQLASAQADYARSLEGGATEGKGDVVKAAELAQRALAPRVPHVRILVAGVDAARLPTAATATIDDRTVPTGAPVAVDPGAHRLVVSAPSRRSVTSTVKLVEGQQLDVPVTLEPESVMPSAPVAAASTSGPRTGDERASSRDDDGRDDTARPSPTWRTAGAVSAGVGVVALGIGVVFGLDAKSKHDAAVKVCPDTCASARDAKLWSDAVSAGNASTVAFIVGGIGVVGGAILWFAAPSTGNGGVTTRVGIGPGSVQLHGVW